MKLPVFNRIGSKKTMLKDLEKYIPKDNIKTFVEPFVGSGIVFLNLSDRADKIVINDLDSKLVKAYKFLKNLNERDFESYRILDKKRYKDEQKYTSMLNKIWNKLLAKGDNLTDEEYFIKELLNTLTFGSIGKGKIYVRGNNLFNRFEKRVPDMIKKLKDTVIMNKSYEEVLEKYDNQNTFFYLDPPYENTQYSLYTHSSFDLENLEKNLRNLKGKFLLSLNDSSNVRKIFENYRIVSIQVKANNNLGNRLSKSNMRNELLIMNY